MKRRLFTILSTFVVLLSVSCAARPPTEIPADVQATDELNDHEKLELRRILERIRRAASSNDERQALEELWKWSRETRYLFTLMTWRQEDRKPLRVSEASRTSRPVLMQIEILNKDRSRVVRRFSHAVIDNGNILWLLLE